MMLVDANALLYAVNSDSPWHEESKGWLDHSLVGGEPVGFAWVVLLSFWRIATHPAVFRDPIDAVTAGAIVEEWLAQPAALVVHPSTRHLSILRGLLREVGTAANLVSDAHVAALALEHGATVITYDSDFSRFAGVQYRKPAA
jgi:uncharacterized protein